jgi:hypothetical protein
MNAMQMERNVFMRKQIETAIWRVCLHDPKVQKGDQLLVSRAPCLGKSALKAMKARNLGTSRTTYSSSLGVYGASINGGSAQERILPASYVKISISRLLCNPAIAEK